MPPDAAADREQSTFPRQFACAIAPDPMVFLSPVGGSRSRGRAMAAPHAEKPIGSAASSGTTNWRGQIDHSGARSNRMPIERAEPEHPYPYRSPFDPSRNALRPRCLQPLNPHRDMETANRGRAWRVDRARGATNSRPKAWSCADHSTLPGAHMPDGGGHHGRYFYPRHRDSRPCQTLSRFFLAIGPSLFGDAAIDLREVRAPRARQSA